jgi:16S rRNA (guanine527-N7)-methyltransferase
MIARIAEERLEAMSRRFELPASAPSRLASLLTLLLEDPLAPTAVREQSKAIDDHLADSLVALELDQVRRAAAVADLGSGAGLPGLPLAIALRGAQFALVESAARKCAFLERAVDACDVPNVQVVNARAESWHEGLGSRDLVTARALAALPVVIEYAAPLLRVGGTLVAWRGRREPDAEAVARTAASQVGMELVSVERVHPYPRAEQRHLHVYSKIMETPDRFPRRPGMASKRPLGTPARIPSDRHPL